MWLTQDALLTEAVRAIKWENTLSKIVRNLNSATENELHRKSNRPNYASNSKDIDDRGTIYQPFSRENSLRSHCIEDKATQNHLKHSWRRRKKKWKPTNTSKSVWPWVQRLSNNKRERCMVRRKTIELPEAFLCAAWPIWETRASTGQPHRDLASTLRLLHLNVSSKSIAI